MSLETFFAGFKKLGNGCVASFPVGGNDAIEFLKMLGVWRASATTLNTCKKCKGIGVIAGCSDFTAGPHLTAFYFIQCDGTGDLFKARGVILIPASPEHEPCADLTLTTMAAQVAADAARKGLKLIS